MKKRGNRPKNLRVRVTYEKVGKPIPTRNPTNRRMLLLSSGTPITLTLTGDSSVDEDALYTLNIAVSGDGVAGITGYTVDWGDGSPVESASVGNNTHTYADPGSRNITVTALHPTETVVEQKTITVNNLGPIPIIPGAGGFGIDTVAGSGRHLGTPATTVIKVTNLNSSGTGSLAWACSQSYPRVIVFEVSGVIDMNGSDLLIEHPYCTIAGQTAPDPGIAIYKAGVIVRQTHDVLIQHISIRQGDYSPLPDDNRDCIVVDTGIGSPEAYNIVFDHCSMAWASDETLTFWGGWDTSQGAYRAAVRDCTVRYCLIGEPIYRTNGTLHPSGQHNYGILLGDACENITLASTVMSHCSARLPLSRTNGGEIFNNWVQGWKYRGIDIGQAGPNPTPKHHIIGNHCVMGPGSLQPDGIEIRSSAPDDSVYIDNNIHPLNDGTQDGWVGVDDQTNGAARSNSLVFTGSGLTPIPANQVKADLLANAGSRPANRNTVDTRILGYVENENGDWLESPDPLITNPGLTQNTRALTVPANKDVVQPSGYTNLEEWLHGYANTVEGT